MSSSGLPSIGGERAKPFILFDDERDVIYKLREAKNAKKAKGAEAGGVESTGGVASVNAAGVVKSRMVNLAVVGVVVIILSLLSLLSLVMGYLCMQQGLSKSVAYSPILASFAPAPTGSAMSPSCPALPPITGVAVTNLNYVIFCIALSVVGVLLGCFGIWLHVSNVSKAEQWRYALTGMTAGSLAKANALLFFILATGICLLVGNVFVYQCVVQLNPDLKTNWAAIIAIIVMAVNAIQILMAATVMGVMNTPLATNSRLSALLSASPLPFTAGQTTLTRTNDELERKKEYLEAKTQQAIESLTTSTAETAFKK